MGIWKRCYDSGTKVLEKATLIYSAMQIGDNANDGEKVQAAVKNYEAQRNAIDYLQKQEDSKALQYTIVTFIIVVAIFILVIGIKMLLSKNKPENSPSIALTTLREGPRTIHNNNNSSSPC